MNLPGLLCHSLLPPCCALYACCTGCTLHVGNFERGAAKGRSIKVGWHFAQRSQTEWPWAPSPDRARRRGSAVDAAVVTFLLPKQSSLPQVLVAGTVAAVAGTVVAVAAMRADVLGSGLEHREMTCKLLVPT